MPYDGELANKASHFDIVRNKDVTNFLKECDYLVPPSPEEAEKVCSVFQEAPPVEDVGLPNIVLAIDGSFYESSISERLPSTRVGYVKIGCIALDMNSFNSLRVLGSNHVDPFRVAQLQEGTNAFTFVLPSANMIRKGNVSVQASFRQAVDEHLYTIGRIEPNDPSTSVRATLFHLASKDKELIGPSGKGKIRLHKCPTCGRGDKPGESIEVEDIPDTQHCPYCREAVYPSDCLRIWEEVGDFQPNTTAISRFMLAVEHLMFIHYIRYLYLHYPQALSSIAFFVDGPLAIFMNAAPLHKPIMKTIYQLNKELERRGLPTLLMIGIQKTGQLVDYANSITKYLPENRIFCVDDDYRYRYIVTSRPTAQLGFGALDHYGQDFIYKTSSNRIFVFSLPYPFATKDPERQFIQEKTDIARYKELPRALKLIQHLEYDLYENAVVPTALANRYTAISLVPGGKVLDLLTRTALKRQLPSFNLT